MRTHKNTRNAAMVVACFLAMTAGMMFGARDGTRDNVFAGIPNGPVGSDPAITITSDAQLAAYPGNGSVENPYIIGNFSILLESGTAISIANTRKHLLIKNCTVRTSTGANTHYGIKMQNVSNARLEENKGYRNYYGIHLNNCSFTSINGNNLSASLSTDRNTFCIYLGHTTNISLYGNVADYFNQGAVSIIQGSNITGMENYFTRGGSGIYDSGFYLSDAIHCTFRNNTISQIANGLFQDGGSDIVFENNTVLESVYRGIYLEDVRDVIVRNNTFSNPSIQNVYINKNVTNLMISHNVINGNGGIRLENGDGWNVTVAHNTIAGTGSTGSHGMYINGGHQFNITSNYLFRAGETGIQMLNSEDSVIELNNITRCAYRGIYFSTNVTSTIVSGNEVGNHTHTTFGFGIRADNSHWNNFTGNYMHDNDKGGLILVSANWNNVWNNNLTRSAGEMLYASAACYLLSASWNDVFNNTIYDNEMCGITLAYGSYHNRIRENMIVDTEFHGIFLSELAQSVGPDHSIIEGNVIANTVSPGIDWEYSGILVEYVTNVTIVNNRIMNNTIYGISMYETYDSLVHGNRIENHNTSIFIEYCNNIHVHGNAFYNANGSHGYFSNTGALYFDNGSHGNYWDDYQSLYPGAVINNGIWSMPYAIDGFQDGYPLAWDPTAKNEQSPALSGTTIDPASGNQLTTFTFNVTYTDVDNNMPLWVLLIVNGTEFKMEKVNPSDSNYTDGCQYSKSLFLQPGTNEYVIETTDGKFSNTTLAATFNVTASANTHAPVLTGGSVDPGSGYLPTLFTFSVNYSDADNYAPEWVRVTINGTAFPMSKEDPDDTNYMDSCLYTYKTNLPSVGNYTYTFQASDGTFLSAVHGSFPALNVRLEPTFNDAVDTDTLVFMHGGSATWFPQTNASYDAIDAARSGYVVDDGISWFETTVQGPGTIQFYWSVSSEEDYDYLTFYVGGTTINAISGIISWTLVEHDITTTGTVTLRWEYSKDGSVSDGDDCGWVDMIAWTYTGVPPTVPGAPQNLNAVAGDSSVSLSWNAPASNGGSAITGYAIYRSTTSGAGYAWVANVTGTSHTDTGLTNGQAYYYIVKAYNVAGEGPASGQASATPSTATVPSAPQDVNAVAGDGSVSLSWNAPASNGGSVITGYSIYRSTTSGAGYAWVANVTGTSYTNTGLTNGQAYYYIVKARNAVGDGPASAQASATPAAGSTSTGDVMAAHATYHLVVFLIATAAFCTYLFVSFKLQQKRR